MKTRYSSNSDISTGPFASDPGWREWWWLGIPSVIAIFVLALFLQDPELYIKFVQAEGYGLLELAHFFIPLAGFVLAFMMVCDPWVRARRLVFAYVVIMALGCIYIAGEEQSWGQHFLNWSTPQSWSEINSQNETNLHNVSVFFGKLPRFLLELGIVVGGILLPITLRMRPELHRLPIGFFFPANALMATALFFVAFKIWGILLNLKLAPGVVVGPGVTVRASELTETYIYLFILFYLIVLRRRTSERRMP